MTDYTFDAKEITLKILSCIYRAEEKYGAYLIASTLCGKKNKKIEEYGLDKLTTFGIVSDFKTYEVRAIIYDLLHKRFILRSTEHGNLKLTVKGKQFLKGKPPFLLPKKILENVQWSIFSKRILATHLGTLTLWQKGLKTSEIAEIRHLKETTIEEHFSDLVFHDRIIDISSIVPIEKEIQIKRVLAENQENLRLKQVKKYLPPDITYGQIKIVTAMFLKSVGK